MCIRDRHGAGRTPGTLRGRDGDRGRRQCRGAAPAARAEPVSYTHLRAHETVLDLVCRLWLEKKHGLGVVSAAILRSTRRFVGPSSLDGTRISIASRTIEH